MLKTHKEVDDDKIATAKRKASVQCKCSNRVPYHVFNKKGWAVCNICGSKILKPKEQFKSDLLNALKKVGQ